MTALAINHQYRYHRSSELAAEADGSHLRLATCGGIDEAPQFFRGKLLHPRQTADLLRGLVQIVQSRFHVPPAMLARILALADPVVTSNKDVLRFEAFSACCSNYARVELIPAAADGRILGRGENKLVFLAAMRGRDFTTNKHSLLFEAFSACCSTYARVDLLPAALDGQIQGRGTTNVDFNAAMRAALARVRATDQVELAVGADALELRCGAETLVERKVALPLRWLKGFVEVQAYQARMQPCLEVSGAEAWRFLRSLPRGTVKHPCWILPAGRGLRLSHQATAGGVCLGGLQRLRVLEDLA